MTKQDLSPLIKRLIEKEINNQADTYTHNGSTWIIFTNEKKWVIELTKEKTLWYNYYFFTKIFKVIGLDVVENQHYITKWVEDTIINPVKQSRPNQMDEPLRVKDTIQNGVKDIRQGIPLLGFQVEDTIQNGVKKTKRGILVQELSFEGVIENGVKNTYSDKIPHDYDWSDQFTEEIDDIIENGVKETKEEPSQRTWMSQQVIENGVKGTKAGGYLGFVEKKGKKIHQFETAKQLYYVEDVIESGIKKTEGGVLFDESKIDTVIIEGVKETHDDVMPHTGRVKGVIKNGVKQCIPSHTQLYNPMDFSVEYLENHRIDDVASVLEKGIKEVQPLPAQDGNRDWGIYYHRQEVPTKPHTQYVDDVIKKGYLCD